MAITSLQFSDTYEPSSTSTSSTPKTWTPTLTSTMQTQVENQINLGKIYIGTTFFYSTKVSNTFSQWQAYVGIVRGPSHHGDPTLSGIKPFYSEKTTTENNDTSPYSKTGILQGCLYSKDNLNFTIPNLKYVYYYRQGSMSLTRYYDSIILSYRQTYWFVDNIDEIPTESTTNGTTNIGYFNNKWILQTSPIQYYHTASINNISTDTNTNLVDTIQHYNIVCEQSTAQVNYYFGETLLNSVIYNCGQYYQLPNLPNAEILTGYKRIGWISNKYLADSQDIYAYYKSNNEDGCCHFYINSYSSSPNHYNFNFISEIFFDTSEHNLLYNYYCIDFPYAIQFTLTHNNNTSTKYGYYNSIISSPSSMSGYTIDYWYHDNIKTNILTDITLGEINNSNKTFINGGNYYSIITPNEYNVNAYYYLHGNQTEIPIEKPQGKNTFTYDNDTIYLEAPIINGAEFQYWMNNYNTTKITQANYAYINNIPQDVVWYAVYYIDGLRFETNNLQNIYYFNSNGTQYPIKKIYFIKNQYEHYLLYKQNET